MSYRVNREKELSDDAENNTAVASVGSNNKKYSVDLTHPHNRQTYSRRITERPTRTLTRQSLLQHAVSFREYFLLCLVNLISLSFSERAAGHCPNPLQETSQASSIR